MLLAVCHQRDGALSEFSSPTGPCAILLRQYFPKKTDFRDISHHALAHVTNRLNNRPRKRLHYLTPLEALNKAGFALQM